VCGPHLRVSCLQDHAGAPLAGVLPCPMDTREGYKNFQADLAGAKEGMEFATIFTLPQPLPSREGGFDIAGG
jgi:hypothetical protein